MECKRSVKSLQLATFGRYTITSVAVLILLGNNREDQDSHARYASKTNPTL